LSALIVDELSSSSAMHVAGFHERVQSRFEHQTLAAIACDHRHLVVRQDDALLGGVTLIPFASISADPVVRQHWAGDLARPGLKMARLWTNGSQRVLASLLRGTLQHLRVHVSDAYVFGVLSISLDFARRKCAAILPSEVALRARVPLDTCDWPARAQPTSDGERLLLGYFRLGAEVIGAASGEPATSSVKLLLGVDLRKVRFARWSAT